MKIDPNGKMPPNSTIITGSINLCNKIIISTQEELLHVRTIFFQELVLEQCSLYKAHQHFQTCFVQELHPQGSMVAQQINKYKQQ